MNENLNIKNILLLDDEEMILESMSILLKMLGYNVFTASSGTEAINLFKENLKTDNKIDVAILDIYIPNDIGGIECNKIIKDLDRNIFTIIVSGDSTNEVFEKYNEYLFDYALSKPYSISKMKEVLENINNID
jgi:DNA-binding NtrC family response regulator